MKNKDNILGNKIQELRVKKGLSQAQLAKNAKIARTLVTMIETGQRVPTDEALIKILKQLDISKDTFMNEIKDSARDELLNRIKSSDAESIVKMYRKVSYDN